MTEWKIIKDLGKGLALAIPKDAELPASVAVIRTPKKESPSKRSTAKK